MYSYANYLYICTVCYSYVSVCYSYYSCGCGVLVMIADRSIPSHYNKLKYVRVITAVKLRAMQKEPK